MAEVASWYAASAWGLHVDVLLWLFFLYSFAGVLIEGAFALVTTGQLELRLGLLYLPLRPIYGLGGAGSTLFLTPLLHRPVLVFVLSALICSVVEYMAGWAVERAFGTTSWDYSDKRLNLHGRICLQYSLAWGLLATAAMYGCQSLVADADAQPGSRLGETLLTVLLVLTLLSAVLTLAALARTRRRVDAFSGRARGERADDSGARWDRLVARLVPDPVLIHSFAAMGLSAELRALARDRQAPGAGSGRAGGRAGAHALDVGDLRVRAPSGTPSGTPSRRQVPSKQSTRT